MLKGWQKALLKHRWIRNARKVIHHRYFASRYVFFCVLVLAVSVTTWATLGGKLQGTNADQLVDPYLFEHGSTLQGALFPGSHTFLIKWPIFILVRLLGASSEVYLAVTTLVALLTVGIFAYILYRIERRPLVFGTLCLALASVLLLVPPVPYSGALLPVNMAMLATRNLEYIIYLGAAIVLIRARSLRRWQAWLGIGLLALLIASDKLFVSLSVGAASIGLVLYALSRRWSRAGLAAWALVVVIASMVAAVIVLAVIDMAGITSIAGQAAAGPYGLNTDPKQLVLGSIYAVLAVLTNFGANPAFDATVVGDIGSRMHDRLLNPSGPAFIINGAILLFALYAAWQHVVASLRAKKYRGLQIDSWSHVAVGLIWASVVAIIVFIATNHYYAVDARYLTLALFAGFVSLASFSRHKQLKPELLVVAGVIMVFGMVLALPVTLRTYWDDRVALTEVRGRNDLVAEALKQHPVKVLVGDYWRVLPIKNVAEKQQSVMPLSDCTTPRDALSSKVWQPSLKHTSFSYLLSLDASLTDFPRCSYQDVVKAYGLPNASLVIAGRVSAPKELLLFYDRGIQEHDNTKGETVASIAPTPLAKLPDRNCEVPTMMNIVAHEDDDLLFMNPDLLHDIEKGFCVRTVYVTAGDAGSNYFYWLGREQATMAAYSKMTGSQAAWTQRTVALGDNQYATVVTPLDNAKITLMFLHMPDGNTNGAGFPSSSYESLAKLQSGGIPIMHAVDGQSEYTYQDLVAAVTKLLHFYQPAQIRTQSTVVSGGFPDHSDHMAVSSLASEAYGRYEQEQYNGQVTIPLKFYVGYPVRDFGENVDGNDLEKKTAAFLTYAKYDGAVCHSAQQCNHASVYGQYLRRQYQQP